MLDVLIVRGLFDGSVCLDYSFRHSSISQSTYNEVGALLCVSTQIDCPTFDQLKRSQFEVRRSKTLVGEISVGVRRLKVPALGLIANLTRLPCASATALGIVNPQVLLGVYLEAGVAFIPQW